MSQDDETQVAQALQRIEASLQAMLKSTVGVRPEGVEGAEGVEEAEGDAYKRRIVALFSAAVDRAQLSACHPDLLEAVLGDIRGTASATIGWNLYRASTARLRSLVRATSALRAREQLLHRDGAAGGEGLTEMALRTVAKEQCHGAGLYAYHRWLCSSESPQKRFWQVDRLCTLANDVSRLADLRNTYLAWSKPQRQESVLRGVLTRLEEEHAARAEEDAQIGQAADSFSSR